MKATPAAQQRLLDLAAADAELSRLAHRRRTLPEHTELAEAEAQVRAGKDKLVEIETAAGDLDRDIRRIERDVEGVRARTEKDRSLLAGSGIGAKQATDLQHELELIRGKSRPHTPKRWVSMLEGRAEMQRVYEGMAARGIVEHVGEKHLGVFKSTRYPEKDHAPEAALLQKIQAALGGPPAESGTQSAPATDAGTQSAPATDAGTQDAPATDAGTPESGATDAPASAAGTAAPAKPDAKAPDARTTALIALLHAAGLFGRIFPAADKGRASELAKDYWPARAVEDELLMVRLAQEEEATL